MSSAAKPLKNPQESCTDEGDRRRLPQLRPPSSISDSIHPGESQINSSRMKLLGELPNPVRILLCKPVGRFVLPSSPRSFSPPPLDFFHRRHLTGALSSRQVICHETVAACTIAIVDSGRLRRRDHCRRVRMKVLCISSFGCDGRGAAIRRRCRPQARRRALQLLLQLPFSTKPMTVNDVTFGEKLGFHC